MDKSPYFYWYVGLLWPALLALAFLYYRRTVPEISRKSRRVLLLLRAATLSGLVLALAQLVFDWETSRPQVPRWQVLVDYSTSMDRVDAKGRSRLASALELAGDTAWSNRRAGVQIERDFFAAQLSSDTAGMDREGTDLEAALTKLAQSSQRPGAVVVLSDGAVNGSSDPSTTRWPFPVYSICLGDSTPKFDLAVKQLTGPATAVAGDSVTMVLTASSEGEPTQAVVQFQSGGARVSRAERFEGGGRTQELRFSFRPDTAGLYQLRATVAPGTEEMTTANNQVEAHVYVEPRKRRTLLLGGAPDWETAFLSRALSHNDRLELDVRYRKLQAGNRHPWPQTLDSLSVFDAVIISDMPASEWSNLVTPLARYVQEGGGLLFLVGPKAAAATWQPDQEKLLSVKPPVSPAGVMSVDASVRVSPGGIYHPVTSTDEHNKGWGDLSRLSGVVPVQEEGGAQRLLEVNQTGISWPVMVASKSGGGRVLTVTGFPLWRSGFAPQAVESVADYESFWQRALVWLCTSSQASRLTVEAPEKPLPLFTAPEVGAVLVDEAWRPDSRATLTCVVRDKDSNLVQTFELAPSGSGRYHGTGRPMPAGDYRYEVQAMRDTLRIARQVGPLSVSAVSREALEPAARPAILDGLAAATGGRRFSQETWRDELGLLPRTEEVQVRYGSLKVWDHPILLTVLLLLLAAEWILRRRYQML